MNAKYDFIKAIESMNEIERRFFVAYCTVVRTETGIDLEEMYDTGSEASAYAIFPQWEILRYRVDFAHLNIRLAIEIDGLEAHGTTEQIANDRRREREIKTQGWEFMRFGGKEIYHDAEKHARELFEVIRASWESFNDIEKKAYAAMYGATPTTMAMDFANSFNDGDIPEPYASVIRGVCISDRRALHKQEPGKGFLRAFEAFEVYPEDIDATHVFVFAGLPLFLTIRMFWNDVQERIVAMMLDIHPLIASNAEPMAKMQDYIRENIDQRTLCIGADKTIRRLKATGNPMPQAEFTEDDQEPVDPDTYAEIMNRDTQNFTSGKPPEGSVEVGVIKKQAGWCVRLYRVTPEKRHVLQDGPVFRTKAAADKDLKQFWEELNKVGPHR